MLLIFFILILLHNSAVSSQSLDIAYQSSIILNGKLYFFGGISIDTYTYTNQTIYLDLSAQFSLTQIKQSFVTSDISPYYKASLALKGNKLYLISGSRDVVYKNLGYGSIIYSTTTDSFNTWNPETLDGQSQLSKVNETLYAQDSNGNTYITGSGINNMYKFDINSLSIISLKPTNDGPSIIRSSFFTCHLLNDQNIIYLGNDLTKLNMYSIKDNQWSVVSTSGGKPSQRIGHSSVLAPDGRIIVYGGTDDPEKLAILDTTQNPFQWTIPENITHPVQTLHEGHSANLYGNYMLISFGWFVAGDVSDIKPFSRVLMLDISDKNDYKWLNTHDSPSIVFPKITGSNIATTTNQATGSAEAISSGTSIPVHMIIGIAIGAALVISLMSVLVWLIRKSRKSKLEMKKHIDNNI